jgi:MHS family proline/betaine transporter-like MFS transporter
LLLFSKKQTFLADGRSKSKRRSRGRLRRYDTCRQRGGDAPQLGAEKLMVPEVAIAIVNMAIHRSVLWHAHDTDRQQIARQAWRLLSRVVEYQRRAAQGIHLAGTTLSAPLHTKASAAGLGRTICAASVGNVLEFYDFTVFGYFATQIAAAFFPASHPKLGLLLTLGTYGVSFLARPLGAMYLGSYADRRGRRASLTLSIWLMTIGTLMLVCMPGYATIGVLAPLGILAGRIVQGFSTGGEFGSATAFMIEHAPSRRGFFGSMQFVSQSLASLMGSGAALAISASMSPAGLQHWGFRLPFVLGLLIAPVGIYVRRHVEETPAYASQTPHAAPVAALIGKHGWRMVLCACLIAGGTAGTYLAIYIPTYAQHQLHMSAQGSFAAPFAANFAGLIVTPVAAHLSDRHARLPIMIGGALCLLAVAYPAFLLIGAYPNAMMLTSMVVLIGIPRMVYTAPLPAVLAEMFPTGVRVAGMSLSYTLGVIVFGGFAGFIVEWLINETGDPLMPAYYLAAATAITLTALLVIRRRMPMFVWEA